MHLPKAGGWHARVLPVLPMKPGCFPIGSPQSRAAARYLLAARKKASEELRFQAVSILDGSPVNLDGLPEIIRAARDEESGRGITRFAPGSRGRARQQRENGRRLPIRANQKGQGTGARLGDYALGAPQRGGC